ANNKGAWGNLTGAFLAGGAVNHDGAVWIADNDIADVTASTPAGGNADWFNLTAAISGLTAVSSDTDTTAGRAITVGWLGYGANTTAPIFTDMDNVTKINALFFRAAAGAAHAPTTKALAGRMTQLNASGAFMQEVMWSNDSDHGYAYRFTDDANSAVWQATWIIPGDGILYGVDDAGDARTAIGAAGSGAIDSSGLTMTAGRVAGRLGSDGAVEQLTGAQLLELADAVKAGRIASNGMT